MNQFQIKAPNRSSMPDLSNLSSLLTISHVLKITYQGAGTDDVEGRLYLRSYIRLVVKTIEDYELSRVCFHQFVNRKNNTQLDPLLRGVGHMENCFNSLVRTLRFASSIADHAELSSQVIELDALHPDNRERISKIRNSIEHMDDRVRNGKIGNAELSALWMDEDFLILEDRKIEYRELGSWLTELHSLADQLTGYGAQ